MDERAIKEMRHAIGLDYKSQRRGKYEAYRNYAQYNEPHSIWEQLIKDGYAECHIEENEHMIPNKSYWYSINRAGLNLIESMIGAKIEVAR